MLLVLVACSSNKAIIENTTLCEFDQTIKEEELFFDTKKHTKQRDTIINNDDFLSRYYVWHDTGTITNKQTNKQTNIGKWLSYYPSGKIMILRFKYLDGQVELGKKTYYDEQGNITKVIDHEKGYTICWKQAIEIVKQKKPKNYLISGMERRKMTHKGKEVLTWGVGVMEPDKKRRGWAYFIDAQTGKFIKKVRVYSNPG